MKPKSVSPTYDSCPPGSPCSPGTGTLRTGELGGLSCHILPGGPTYLLPDAPLEEPFAALATDGAIVPTWNQTESDLSTFQMPEGGGFLRNFRLTLASSSGRWEITQFGHRPTSRKQHSCIVKTKTAKGREITFP